MLKVNTREYRQAMLALSFGAFLIFANLYAIQPLLVIFNQKFAISFTQANWIFAAASLAMSLSLIPWALIADRFGRRLVMLVSLLWVTLNTLLLSLDIGFEAWVLLRFLQGIALAGIPAVAIAYMTEEIEPPAVMGAVGIYIAANSLGGISGRLLSAFISQYFSIDKAMCFFALLSALGCLLLFTLPKERQFAATSLQPKSLIINLCGHIRHPLLWRIFLISGICMGIFINLFSVVALRLSQLPWSFSAAQLSLLFLCYLGGTLSSSFAGRFNQRISPFKSLLLGWGILVIGVLLCAFNALTLLILGLLASSIGFFLLHAVASTLVAKYAQQARALASALYLSCYYLGASLGGFYLINIYQQFAWRWVIGAALALLLPVPLLIAGLIANLQAENSPSQVA